LGIEKLATKKYDKKDLGADCCSGTENNTQPK